MSKDKTPTVAKFSFDGMDFEIYIGVREAYHLKHEFDINLLNMFEDSNLEAFTQVLTFNDEKVIDIWWDYIKTKISDREKAVDKLTRDDLTKFKEAFWAAIINFSDPAGKQLILELKRRLPELLKRQILNGLDELEKNPPSPSSLNSLPSST